MANKPVNSNEKSEAWKSSYKKYNEYDAQKAELLKKLDHLNQQYVYLAQTNGGIEPLMRKSVECLKTAEKFFRTIGDSHIDDFCGQKFHPTIKRLTKDDVMFSYTSPYEKTYQRIVDVKNRLKKEMRNVAKDVNSVINKMNWIHLQYNDIGESQAQIPEEEAFNYYGARSH